MICSLLLTLLVAAPAPELRLAVVVGSNRAVDGGAGLRYAHSDARELADVLRTTGHFAAEDVATLLDPEASAVLAAIASAAARSREAKRPALFLFYYSGHANDRALYPGGDALELSNLKQALEDPAFEVKIGIIDSCRGGGWTQAKGLHPAAPFDVAPPGLASEGTALFAASSGLEDAHEAEALKGSFFTHHLVAGLRGAADQSGDGQVTLSELYAYADGLTIRDSATRSPQPQHPSFDMRLRGRQDLVLADLRGNPSLLTVAQTVGPLQVVQLSTGLVVVEATPGEKLLRVALPPGAYLVRRLTDAGVRSREVRVVAGQATSVEETSLALVGEPALAAKSAVQLEGRHVLSLGGAKIPDVFVAGWAVQGMYRWRFSNPFALRVRGLYSFPAPTEYAKVLTSEFKVKLDSFEFIRFIAGVDLEWLTLSVPGRFASLTVGISLGGSAVVDSRLRPAATMTGTLALHATALPELALVAEVLAHVRSLPLSAAQLQWNVAIAWHFK